MKKSIALLLGIALMLTVYSASAVVPTALAMSSPTISVVDLSANPEVPNYVGAAQRQNQTPYFISVPKATLVMEGGTLKLRFTFFATGFEQVKIFFDGVLTNENQYVRIYVGPKLNPNYVIVEVVNFGYSAYPTTVDVHIVTRYGVAAASVRVTMEKP